MVPKKRFEELVERLHECRDTLASVHDVLRLAWPSNVLLLRELAETREALEETLKGIIAEELESAHWPPKTHEV